MRYGFTFYLVFIVLLATFVRKRKEFNIPFNGKMIFTWEHDVILLIFLLYIFFSSVLGIFLTLIKLRKFPQFQPWYFSNLADASLFCLDGLRVSSVKMRPTYYSYRPNYSGMNCLNRGGVITMFQSSNTWFAPNSSSTKMANPSFSHKSFHHLIVTRFPNHWNKQLYVVTCVLDQRPVLYFYFTYFNVAPTLQSLDQTCTLLLFYVFKCGANS